MSRDRERDSGRWGDRGNDNSWSGGWNDWNKGNDQPDWKRSQGWESQGSGGRVGGGGGGGGGGSGGGEQHDDLLKVFAAQLPMDITEDEIRTIFGTYGQVVEVRIIDGKPAGAHKCAFVGYSTEQGASTAIQALNENYRFRLDSPRPIRVEYSKLKGGASANDTPSHGGRGGLLSAPGGNDRDRDRDQRGGYNDSRQDSWQDNNWGNNRQASAGGHGSSSSSSFRPGEASEDAKVFVGNLPMDIQEHEIRTIFGTYGSVVDVKIIDGKPPGASKCAFVGFSDSKSSRTAMELLHNVYKFRPDSERPIRVESTNRGNHGGGGGGGGGDRDDYRSRGDYGTRASHSEAPSNAGQSGWQDRGRSDWNQSNDLSRDRHNDRGGHNDHEQQSCKVFVGQLPNDITSEEIKIIFNTYGTVESVFIVDGKQPGMSKIAFVEYSTNAECQVAIKALNDVYRFRQDSPMPIRVSIALPKKQDGKGGGKGSDYEDRSGGGGGRGHRDNRDEGRDWGRQDARDSWAAPPQQNRDGDRPPGPKLHIGNLPADITRADLESVFGTYGRLADVYVMKSTGGHCAAFVVYDHEQDARRCMAAMEQGYEIRPGDGNIHVTYARVKEGGGNRSRPY